MTTCYSDIKKNGTSSRVHKRNSFIKTLMNSYYLHPAVILEDDFNHLF